jgi:hypothetical protein
MSFFSLGVSIVVKTLKEKQYVHRLGRGARAN